ncbi:MAG TPA: ATP-binding cassette domain-containing protein [Acidobacteriaceae bacterium]|nr:ATP-binding cassette domain-containing protein [Acidobacteriaceae bacterium]
MSKPDPSTTHRSSKNPPPDHNGTSVLSHFCHHSLQLHAQVGALALSVDLDLTAPWTVIYGPSGSGKTSILRALAGLLPSTRLLRQNPQQNPQDLTSLAPRDRQIAYAPQQPSLFPHLTVSQNIAFSRPSHTHSTASEQDIHNILSLFHLTALAHRYPRNLSGGERQRVNLARAFAVPNQQLMLLDEPFTGLDRALRDDLLPAMLTFTATHHIPVLSVTHDVEEALQLRAEVVRLQEGRILAQGAAAEVLAAERARILNVLR